PLEVHYNRSQEPLVLPANVVASIDAVLRVEDGSGGVGANPKVAMVVQRVLPVVLLVILSIGFAREAAAKPNIIVVLTDDQADELTMRVLPDGRSLLPKIESLILDQGVRYVNSFTDLPLCAPSRVSLLTGQASHNHGITYNKGSWFAYQPHEPDSLPVWLQA